MRRLIATVFLSLFFFMIFHSTALSQRLSKNMLRLNNSELTKEIGRAENYNDRIRVKKALIKRGRQIIPFLTDGLKSDKTVQKLESLALLRSFRSKESAPKILPLLKDPDKKVRVRAAFSLGKIKNPQAVPGLIQALENAKSTTMIKSILAGLGYIGDKRVVHIVMPYLKHNDRSVQVTAAGSLGLLGNKMGLQIAIEASSSQDYVVQKDAIFALGLIGGSKAKRQIEELLFNPDSHWKSYQLISLFRIELESLPVSGKIERFQELLNHENKAVAKWAVEQLGEIGSTEAIEVLKIKKHEKTRIGLLSERQLNFLGVSD